MHELELVSSSRILVVAEALEVASQLEHRLRRQGYTIAGTARSAEEALAIVARTAVDLALLDLRLAGERDGIEVAGDLNALDIPFVFLTAPADDETFARMQRVMPHGFLLEPFDERLVRLTIEMAVKSERTRGLERERERLQQIIDGMAVYVCILDPAGQVVQVNARVRDSVGHMPASFVGHHIDAMPGLRYGEQAIADIHAALEQARRGHSARCDLQVEGSGGSTSITDTTISPIFDLERRVIGLVSSSIDVTARRAVERRLRESLAEKVVLLHEVHHRVKNNLQVVTSLLYLKGMDASAEVREVLDECSARIRSMAIIHEHLYFAGDIGRIEMREVLAALGDELSRMFSGEGDVRVHVSGEGLRLGIEQAIPVALLANELLTNALKYAYPNLAPGHPAEIRVRIQPDRLEVADDGIGLSVDAENPAPSSLGLRLVRSLARQLDAQLEFSTGAGTCVRLRLPDCG